MIPLTEFKASSSTAAAQPTHELPPDPQDVEVAIPPEPPLPKTSCCDNLVGRCQRIEDCLAMGAGAVSIAGVIYSIVTDNNVLTAFFGFTAICCMAVIIFNKTCGNLPRITRQYEQATERLQLIENREASIVQAFQQQVSSYKQISAQSRMQIESLQKFSIESKAAQEGLQKNLADLQLRSSELEKINDGLKQSIASEKLTNQQLREQIEQLSKGLSGFHADVDRAASSAAGLNKFEDDFKQATGAIGTHEAALHDQIETEASAVKGNVEMYNKLLAANQTLQEQLRVIEDQLRLEKDTNAALKHENEELTVSLGNLRGQLTEMETTMKTEMQQLDRRKDDLEREKAEWDAIRRSIEQSRKAVEESATQHRSIVQTQTHLNEALDQTNAAIRRQIEELDQGDDK